MVLPTLNRGASRLAAVSYFGLGVSFDSHRGRAGDEDEIRDGAMRVCDEVCLSIPTRASVDVPMSLPTGPRHEPYGRRGKRANTKLTDLIDQTHQS